MAVPNQIADWTLADRTDRDEGRHFLTGTQALVKIPLLQAALDVRNGRNTAGYISGYRGSPLGNYDAALWDSADALRARRILFNPGVNEELAATAVFGTQQANQVAAVTPKYDGVFAIWYGKGPGVDRASDALKHGNLAGAAPLGGVLVLAGDDHGGKSSTLAYQSDQALQAAAIPVLHPVSVRDYLTLGLFGFALSRATGLWAGFKCVTDIVESTASFDFHFADADFRAPEGLLDPRHRNPQPGLNVLAEEEALLAWRLPAVRRFAAANPVDRTLLAPAAKRLGIVAVGKAVGDVRQALADMGLTQAGAEALGIGLHAVQMAWPIEPEGLKAFAAGYREILLVEEKRAFVEPQLKDALYALPADVRPDVSGKADPSGKPLLPGHGELSASVVRRAILARLGAHEALTPALTKRAAELLAREAPPLAQAPVPVRMPAFCSGCPHNRSTKVDEGGLALAGIGCHGMTVWMPDRPTVRPAQMGGEGANWIGMAPFVDRPHIVQNLGDGTYFHSGLLAIRAAIAAKSSITYKLLFNDAVAMTGGQPVDGQQTAASIAAQLRAEGIAEVVVVSDDPERTRSNGALPDGVALEDRADLVAVERRLAAIPGVTAIIYDQTCAAEKRRRRKRGAYPDPAKRMFINSAVCEGCGDCGRASNCVSLHPEPTPLGIKRRVDQSSCNKDYSCNEGFCPSFVTVLGAQPRKRQAGGAPIPDSPIPEPVLPALAGVHDILVTGIGGTGVVTVGAIIGTAAHLAGLAASLLDLTGLSQKNGAVMSHIRLSADPDVLHAPRIGLGDADALIGCDLLVSAAADALKLFHPGTQVVLNTHVVPVAAFQRDRDMDLGGDAALAALRRTTAYADDGFDAIALAERLFGNAILSNMLLLGAAFQRGMLPIPASAIERAITLNGVQVKANLAAFAAGRRAVAEPGFAAASAPPPAPLPETLAEIVHAHATHLAAYQDSRLADDYRAFVDRVAGAEARAVPGSSALAAAVARNLGKLMAPKDEYEVARLHTSPAFRAALEAQFEGPMQLQFNLAPPLFSRRDPVTGLPRKRAFGPWILPLFRVLAAAKSVRGTTLDIFGHTAERRRERAIRDQYRQVIEGLLPRLSAGNIAAITAIADLPDQVRGFGHVKEAAMDRYDRALDDALAALNVAQAPAAAEPELVS